MFGGSEICAAWRETFRRQGDAKSSQSGNVSENDLGNWMDENLNVGHVDWKSTDVAVEQATANLEKTPGIILEDMMCGDAFCSTTFSSETSEQQELQK